MKSEKFKMENEELRSENEFVKVKLGDVADIVAGQSPKSEFYTNDDKYMPFLQGNRTFGELYPFYDVYTKKITKLAKKNDILMSVRAPVGDLNIANRDVCIGRGLSAIRANSAKIDYKYLFYFLKIIANNLKSNSSGTTYDSINQDILKNINLKIHKSVDVQKKIARVLSVIDEKIEVNKKINEKLEDMARDLYEYYFVQFDFPNEDGEPYKSSGGEMVYSKELKSEIPKGWEVVKIKEIFDFLEGPGITKNKYANENKGQNFINIRCFTDSKDINLSNANKVKFEFLEQYSHFQLKEKDILLSTSGTLGRIAIVRKEHLPLLLNTSVIRFRSDKLFYNFMYQFLQSKYFIHNLKVLASGSIQKNFGPTHLELIYYFKPPKKVLEKYNEISIPIIEKILINKSQIQKLEDLRNFLLPMLLNGQVEVKD